MTSRKWMLPVLYTLSSGTKRYHEIGAALPGIKQKVLTDALQHLQAYGLVRRVAYPTVPPKVEYGLTELGGSFTVVLTPVVDWAKENLDKGLEAEALCSL